MKVLTAETMGWVDRTTIERGTPGIELMRNAGQAVFEAIAETPGVTRDTKIVVVAGKGNNGGDGFRVAELLKWHGYAVEVFLLGAFDAVRGDALTCLRAMEKPGCEVTRIEGVADCETLKSRIASAGVVVDALFGTGLKGELAGLPAQAVDMINASDAVVFAVDIPSGVDASTGGVSGHTVRADRTVTFGCLKVGHVLFPGKSACGRVSVADIGFSEEVLDAAEPFAHAIVDAEAAALIPERPFDAHKGSVGKVFVLAGSVGLTGAAALSSMAALRVGAGLVTLGCPASLNDILEVKLTEVMTLPLPEVRKKRCLSLRALGQVRERTKDADVTAVGPGLGSYHETADLVRRFLSHYEGTVVLDADGINAFRGDPESLAAAAGDIVLTPHVGELSRLTGIPISDILDDTIVSARDAASRTGEILLLKGVPTIIASPSGETWINTTGSEGMATAGMGDVLTGIVTGFAAQGLDPLKAAVLGAYVHGRAGEIVAGEKGVHGLMAGDVLDALPGAMIGIRAGR